ncbi:glycosyl transferase [Micromonospora coerulea]|uniref:Glycosyl transferase n=1 Tax=Micromonospora coerulea TaxID=47856 RepID=A0ABP8T5Y6_9ACTN
MTTPESDGGAGAAPDRGVRRMPGWSIDLVAVLSFVLLAFWVTARFWVNPGDGVRDNPSDQAQFQWMMAHGARVVTDFAYPFTSDRMNVPDGVNLMANTSVLSVSLPMTPVTVFFGPRAAFLLFLTGGLIATAVAWYFVLSRVLLRARGPAWLGAGFCAFAPAMVSHANAHPNIVSQFVVPLIVWRTLRLAEPGRWLRNGVLLGLVIVWQAFINLEILLMTAIGIGVVVCALVLGRPELRRRVRPFTAGLAVAAAVAGVLLAYPLYVQFFGPGAYQGLSPLIRGYSTDLASFVAWSGESVAGDPRSSARLAKNATEENAFFGWPLVVLVIALVWWLRHNAVVLGLAAVGLLFALFSLGREIRFDGRDTGVPGPWAALENLPILHSVVPTRWSLALTPIIGVLLALGADGARRLARRHPDARPRIRFVTATVLAMALVPILPTPLPSVRLDPIPEFVTSGAWRPYVAGGHSIVTLPLPDTTYADPLRWSAETRLEMPLARGYFLYPDTRPGAGRIALFTAPPRPTSSFFDMIRRTDAVPPITPQDRVAAVDDLRYWRAGAVLLDPHCPQADALRRGMTELTGIDPVRTGGVWLWDVRPLVD